MDLNFNWWDLVVFGLIIVISYWIAFKSGASKLFERRVKEKRIRGTISGENKLKSQSKSFIKKFDILILFRSESKASKVCAKEFFEFALQAGFKCEMCDIEAYDLEVLEQLDSSVTIIFAIDRSEKLFNFIRKKENDPKYIRAYSRRRLNNLRYAVIGGIDQSFAQFIDEGLEEIGGIRIQSISNNTEKFSKWSRDLCSKL